MAQSAGAPIWFVFVTFGLGISLESAWESVSVRFRRTFAASLLGSNVREEWKNMSIYMLQDNGQLGFWEGAGRLRIFYLWEKAEAEVRFSQAKEKVLGHVLEQEWGSSVSENNSSPSHRPRMCRWYQGQGWACCSLVEKHRVFEELCV